MNALLELVPEVTPRTEPELLQAAKAGDATAFEALTGLHYEKMFGLSYYMLGNYHDASEVTQEVFVKAFKSLANFREESRFSTWLHRILINECHRRRQWFQRKNKLIGGSINTNLMVNTTQLPRQFGDPEADTRGSAAQQELLGVVMRAMANMSEQSRNIILLRDGQGLSYQEIAEVLQCRIGTVRSRLNRGRLQLKKILEKAGYVNLQGL